jgi:spore coat protein U domain-containing protein, fimbrial subunit CupE1/2/3/6
MRRGAKLSRWSAAAVLLSISFPAHAVLESCAISATSVAFGSYDPLSAAPADVAGTVSMTCTVTLVAAGASWNIRLSVGGSGSYAPRRMASGGNFLNYNLYTNAGRTTVWGDGTGGTSYISGSQTLLIGNTAFNYPVYGRIPVAQDRPSGSYTDTIIVTLNY